ncbi:hypothetical protein [Caulobacter segnis]|uniref:hypothetical protein n=1 Tax=Caulobacter segnis TaxID=88688 RepID=UPI001CBAD8FF|nr:hypothetical protein [Caulobacter segnis]UAL10861.1 hypothetical protein K8940_00785 [Caulobacter segnis]
MIGWRVSTILVATTLAGCASAPPIAPAVERIAFAPTPPPFCGRCETVKFVASADGVLRVEAGYWAGNYRDWRRRREVRQITPEQFADFKARLAPYRGQRDIAGGEAGCQSYHTDDAGLRVEWVSDSGRRVRVFDFGCEDDPAMNRIVSAAPTALGLKPLY